MSIPLIIEALKAGLTLWANKEKNKYMDRLMELEKDFYEEWDKPENRRSDDILTRINRELRLLVKAFASAVRSEGAGN